MLQAVGVLLPFVWPAFVVLRLETRRWRSRGDEVRLETVEYMCMLVPRGQSKSHIREIVFSFELSLVQG
jgi:hypothetical protein